MQMTAQITNASRVSLPRLSFPRPSRKMVRPALKSLAFAAFFAAIVGFAYFVLPSLNATGIWAYGVGFLIQATTSASIIVPIPGMAALLVMAQEMDILALAAFGAAGGTVGELVGYWLGMQGRGPLAKTGLYKRLEPAMRRWGGPIIVLFAAIPVLPMDAAGIVAGAIRFPIARYLVAMFTGKFALLLVGFIASRQLASATAFLFD